MEQYKKNALDSMDRWTDYECCIPRNDPQWYLALYRLDLAFLPCDLVPILHDWHKGRKSSTSRVQRIVAIVGAFR
jgi:hypothetical protein